MEEFGQVVAAILVTGMGLFIALVLWAMISIAYRR